MHAAADRIDAGTFYADDDLDGVPIAISAERMDLLHVDGYDGDEDAAAAARLRIWASDLRSGADWLDSVAAAAAAAEKCGSEAVEAAERGDICEALACAKRACSIESQYGDDPIWSVLRRAIETIDEACDTITVTASDDGSSEERDCERGDDYEAIAKEMYEDADYGDGDYRVQITWEATDAGGEEIDGGTFEMVGETEEPPCPAADEHDWTSEGEGGCESNPGVWSTGGTGMNFHSHCRACGLKRVIHHTGSQRNPGECDTTTYGDDDD